MHFEKDALLTELVELWVAVEETSGDKLVEDAHGQWGEESKEDIVKREGPRFINDLARKGVLKGILGRQVSTCGNGCMLQTYPELRHIQRDVFVKRV